MTVAGDTQSESACIENGEAKVKDLATTTLETSMKNVEEVQKKSEVSVNES